MTYANVDCIKDPLKQDLAFEFCGNHNKYFSFLAGTHISHDQIKHIRNNWLAPSFSLLEIVTQKDCLSCFIQVLKVTLRLTLILKGGLCPLRLFPLMTEFSVFILLQGIRPGNSCLGDIFLKDYKVIWKIKVREMKTKQYLENLIVLWIKWTGMVEIKYKDFTDVVPIMPCNNPSWKLIDFTRYGRSSGTRSRKGRVYCDIKITNNNKTNHIMVSFTDHYNAISLDKLPSKTKIERD